MFSIQPPIHQSLAQSQYGTRETAQYGTRETAQYGTRETAQYGTINRDRLELKSSAKFIVLSIFIAFLLVFFILFKQTAVLPVWYAQYWLFIRVYVNRHGSISWWKKIMFCHTIFNVKKKKKGGSHLILIIYIVIFGGRSLIRGIFDS